MTVEKRFNDISHQYSPENDAHCGIEQGLHQIGGQNDVTVNPDRPQYADLSFTVTDVDINDDKHHYSGDQ